MPLPSGVRRPIGGGTQMRTPFAGIGQGAPPTAAIGPQRPAFDPNKARPGGPIQVGPSGGGPAPMVGFDPTGVVDPNQRPLNVGTTMAGGPPPPNSLGMNTAGTQDMAPVGAPPLAGTPPTQQFWPNN